MVTLEPSSEQVRVACLPEELSWAGLGEGELWGAGGT